MQALRVGLVYDDTIDRYGGIGAYVTTLGDALRRRGHLVTHLVGTSVMSERPGSNVRALARNVSVRFNGNHLSMPIWSERRKLDRVMSEGDFDVLHVQVPYSPLMSGRLLARMADHAAAIGTYHVASERLLPKIGAQALRALMVRSAPRFDAHVSVSEAAANFALRWSGIRTSAVVPNPIHAAQIRTQASLGCWDDEMEVVFVGRLVPRKGAEQLVRAVAGMKRRPRVAIIGDGPLRPRIEQLITKLGVRRSIRLYGTVSDEVKAAALAQARIACFPSLYGESFGLVILEALAAGAEMVLGGDNPGYAEVLGDRRALVDPRYAAGFARHLKQLLDDPGLRASIGVRQRLLLERCAADTVAADLIEVYRSALAHRRSKGALAVAA